MHATTTSKKRPDAISALINVSDDLATAKIEAAHYFSGSDPDNVIVILSNSEPVATRRVGGKRWKDL